MDARMEEIRSVASKCDKGLLSPYQTVYAVWPLLDYHILYDRKDLQCGPSPYVYVGKLQFAPWRRGPSEFITFATDVFKRLGQRVAVAETLRHTDFPQASCMLFVSNNEPSKPRAYRGVNKNDAQKMDEARCDAILSALFSALSKDRFLHLSARKEA